MTPVPDGGSPVNDSISHTNVNPRLIQFGVHFFF